MADETGGSQHSAACLRLMQLFPRVTARDAALAGPRRALR